MCHAVSFHKQGKNIDSNMTSNHLKHFLQRERCCFKDEVMQLLPEIVRKCLCFIEPEFAVYQLFGFPAKTKGLNETRCLLGEENGG